MITVQQIREQISDLNRQKAALGSNSKDTNHKAKEEFLNKHINILVDAAAEIMRLQKDNGTLQDNVNYWAWIAHNEEQNHRDTKKQNSRFAHQLQSAGLPPYSLDSRP